jgi:hypothetical protein
LKGSEDQRDRRYHKPVRAQCLAAPLAFVECDYVHVLNFTTTYAKCRCASATWRERNFKSRVSSVVWLRRVVTGGRRLRRELGMARMIVISPSSRRDAKNLHFLPPQLAPAQRHPPVRMRKVTYMEIIRLHQCKRCGKTWFPRSPGKPKICPTCKTPYWNMPRKERILAK